MTGQNHTQKSLFDEVSFEYDDVDFEEIASSSRN